MCLLFSVMISSDGEMALLLPIGSPKNHGGLNHVLVLALDLCSHAMFMYDIANMIPDS